MKYTRKGGANSYNRNTIKKKRNAYTFLPYMNPLLQSDPFVRIRMFTDFDTLACTTVEDNQQWWIDCIAPYRDRILKKYRQITEEKEDYSGIFLHCMDKCVLHAQEKVDIIKGRPGLNIIMSCNTDLTVRKLNERDNPKGIYYLGFQSNVHYLQNILIMPRRHPNYSDFNEIHIRQTNSSEASTTNISTSLEKILRYMLEERGIAGANKDLSCVYFTRHNIQTKIEAILENINKIDTKKLDRISHKNGVFDFADGTVYETYEKFRKDVEGQYNPFSQSYTRNIEKSKQNLQTHRNKTIQEVAEQKDRAKNKQTQRWLRMKQFLGTYQREIENYFTDVGRPEYVSIIKQLPDYYGLDSILNDVDKDFESKDPQERIGELLYAIQSVEDS